VSSTEPQVGTSTTSLHADCTRAPKAAPMQTRKTFGHGGAFPDGRAKRTSPDAIQGSGSPRGHRENGPVPWGAPSSERSWLTSSFGPTRSSRRTCSSTRSGGRAARGRPEHATDVRCAPAQAARTRSPRGSGAGYVLSRRPGRARRQPVRALLREARGADGQSRPGWRQLLREALGLWNGPGVRRPGTRGSLAGEIARLEELRLQALEERLAADLEWVVPER
jgi:hypothetical protein